MKKAIVIVVIIALALIFAATLAADSLRKEIIPASAKWLLHFDIEKFSTTQLFNLLKDDRSTRDIRKINERFSKKFKMNLLEDISSITLFGKGPDEEDTVVCVTGNIDREHLLHLLGLETSHKESTHGKHTIHTWDYDHYGAFVDEHRVIFSGNKQAVQEALDAISGKTANISSSPVMSYINKTPPDAFLMATVENVSAMVRAHKKPVILKKTGMAFFTAREEKENLDIDLNITAKTPEDAQKMEQMIRGLIAFIEMQQEDLPAELRMAEIIKISTDRNKVQVQMIYPSKDLMDIISGKKLPFVFSLAGLQAFN